MQQPAPRLTPLDLPEHGLTVAQAAKRLHISQAAVRQRMRRGTITAYRANGHVYVRVPDAAQEGMAEVQSGAHADSTPGTTADNPPNGTADATVTVLRSQPAPVETTAEAVRTAVEAVTVAYTTLIEQLQGETAFLREELRAEQESRRREVSELHVLLQRAQAQIPMPTIAAPTQEQTDNQSLPQQSRRRHWWWPFSATT